MPDIKVNTDGVDLSVFNQEASVDTSGVDLSAFGVKKKEPSESSDTQLPYKGDNLLGAFDNQANIESGVNTRTLSTIGEAYKQVTPRLETKFIEYVDKNKKALTGGVNLPNPLTAESPEQYKADLDNYARVLRENPMPTETDNKVTAVRMLLDKTKETQAIVDSYADKTIAGKVGEGIQKGLEEYGRGYFEFSDRLKQNTAITTLNTKLERINDGESVPLDEGDKLLLQALSDNANAVSKLDELNTTAYNIGKATGQSLGFTGEFLATGGVGAGLAKGITKGLATKVAEGAAVSTAKKISVGLAAKAAQTGVQVAAMPTFYKGIAEDVSLGENFGKSLLKNYYTTFSENFTERIFLKNPWNTSTVGTVDNFMGRLGVNMHTEKGVLGILASTAEEAAEEKIGEVMQAPVNYDNFKDFWNNYWDVEKNAELLGSVALMTVPMGVVSQTARAYDKVKLNRYAKLVPSELRGEVDQVLGDKTLSLKEQYDLIGKIVNDHIADKTLGETPNKTASDVVQYTIQKTKDEAVTAVEERRDETRKTVGGMENITTADQAKLDYLIGNGVTVSDGTTMEQLNSLYETEKAKQVPITATTENVNELPPPPSDKVIDENGNMVEYKPRSTIEQISPESIPELTQRISSEIERPDLFSDGGEFANILGGSGVVSVPTYRTKSGEVETVGFSNPQTGILDVVMSGTSDHDFAGFYRIYENGKPTNKWSSKMENQSRNKANFKTMMEEAQLALPSEHRYTEKTSISTDGLRVWGQQLNKGYRIEMDDNGNIVTNRVSINGDALINELGIPINAGNFDNVSVTTPEDFSKVKKALLPYLQKLGLTEKNIHWENGTATIDLPVLQKQKQGVVLESEHGSETVPTAEVVSEENKPVDTQNLNVEPQIGEKQPNAQGTAQEPLKQKEQGQGVNEGLEENVKEIENLAQKVSNLPFNTSVNNLPKIMYDFYNKVFDTNFSTYNELYNHSKYDLPGLSMNNPKSFVEDIKQSGAYKATEEQERKQKQQPSVVEQQIQVEQQERQQIEPAAETKIEQRNQRITEIDAELGDVWSKLADVVGAKINLTGEQRAKLMPVVTKLVSLYAEKYSLKGQNLIDEVVAHLRSKNIEPDEELLNEINNASEQQSRTLRQRRNEKGTTEGSSDTNMPEVNRPIVQNRKEAEEKVTSSDKGDRVEVKESRLGIRWAFGKNFSEKEQEKYRTQGLYKYNPEKHSDIELTARSIVDNNPTDRVREVFKDESVSRRVRTAVGVLLAEKLKTESDAAYESGDDILGDRLSDEIVDIFKAVQDDLATEAARDVSFLGSNFLVMRLGGYQLARHFQKAFEASAEAKKGTKGFKRAEKFISDELQKERGKVLDAVINKVVPKQQPNPKIKEIRDKRNSLIEKWKTERKKYVSASVIGLNQADIEFGGKIALTYIEEGVYRTADLVNKLQKVFEEVGVKLTEEDAKALLPDKYEGKPFEEYQNDKDLEKASVSLAKKIFGDVVEKTKTDDPLKEMVNVLFSKFKDTQTERKKTEGKTPLEKIAMAIRDKESYATVWAEARDKAIEIAGEDTEAIDKINKAYENATTFVFSEKMVKDAIRQELAEKETNISDLVRDHYETKDVVKEDLKRSLIDKSGLSESQATELANAIDKAFNTMWADRASVIINRYVNRGKKKVTRTQQRGVDELIQLAQNGAFDTDGFTEAFAAAWGIPELDKADIKYIIDKSRFIDKIKGEKLKYEEKQKLLAYIANIKGVDWGELLDGMWYANVLSGFGTQTKNFLDANSAAIIEPLILSGTSPFKLNRWRKAVARAYKGRGKDAFAYTMATGNHPFELGTDAPNIMNRILKAPNKPEDVNKATWAALRAMAMYNTFVFNAMMGNDAFAGTVAYESMLDVITTNTVYANAIKQNAGKNLSKEEKQKLNDKIDEMLKVRPEDMALINEMIDKESEEFKAIQKSEGREEAGYTKQQRAMRMYELIDELRNPEDVQEARKLAVEVLGNTKPYGTLAMITSRLKSIFDYLQFQVPKPVVLKSGGKIRIVPSPTESITISPTSKIMPFTNIITNIATRNLNWNPLVATSRLARDKFFGYGYGFKISGMPRIGDSFARQLTPQEKKIIYRKIGYTAAITALAWALTGGDDPEDSLIRITANGTGDTKKNKQLMSKGWKPFSIQIGDFSMSYQYIYPLNGILGAVGYARDRQLYTDTDKSFMRLYSEGAVVSIGQVLFSTPLSGLSTALDVLGGLVYRGIDYATDAISKLASNIGGGFYSPNFMNDIDKAFQILTNREDVTGVTVSRKMLDKVPFVGRSLAGNVVALDQFGDAVPVQTSLGSIFEIQNDRKYPNKELADYVIEEMKYFRPIPNMRATNFIMREDNGLVNKKRVLTGGSSLDEYYWTEYNRILGGLFKQKAQRFLDLGYDSERFTKEMDAAWSDMNDQAKTQVFIMSNSEPVETTEVK